MFRFILLVVICIALFSYKDAIVGVAAHGITYAHSLIASSGLLQREAK